ncbi:MAG: DoxX family protein [Reyranella sp.]|nr:DoxX family protein [Reyranella sp.]
MTAFFDTWRARLDAFPQSVLQLFMRFSIFWVFWRSGSLKADNIEQAIGLFREEYKLPILPPEIAAYLGTTVELAAPCLILAGLFTRLAALSLIGLTFTIQFLVYWNDYPSHLLWLAILVFILTRGPGPYSLDALLFRKRGAVNSNNSTKAPATLTRVEPT